MAFSRWLSKLRGEPEGDTTDHSFSLVLLLRIPRHLTEEAIQDAAETAFIDTLEHKGPDSILALQSDHITVIRAGEEMMQVVQFDTAYFQDRYTTAALSDDPRVRDAILEHTAWISVDYLTGTRKKTERNRVAIYRLLAALAAALCGIDTLAVYFVHEEKVVPCDDELIQRLEYFDSLSDLLRWHANVLH